jgi:hypothetical protein
LHSKKEQEAYYNRQLSVLSRIYQDGLQASVVRGVIKRKKSYNPATIRCMDGRLQTVWGPCVAGSLIGQPDRLVEFFLRNSDCSAICSHDDCGAGRKIFWERYNYFPNLLELNEFVRDETSKVSEKWGLQYTHHISAEAMVAPGLGHIEMAVTYLGIGDVSFSDYPRSLIIHRNYLPVQEAIKQAIFACRIVIEAMGKWVTPRRPILLAGVCDVCSPKQKEEFYNELLTVANAFSAPLVRVEIALI